MAFLFLIRDQELLILQSVKRSYFIFQKCISLIVLSQNVILISYFVAAQLMSTKDESTRLEVYLTNKGLPYPYMSWLLS